MIQYILHIVCRTHLLSYIGLFKSFKTKTNMFKSIAYVDLWEALMFLLSRYLTLVIAQKYRVRLYFEHPEYILVNLIAHG